MGTDDLEGATQLPEPVGPACPALRTAATCSKVTANPDGTCTLHGVSEWFVPQWRATPEMPAPLSFVVHVELFAMTSEPPEPGQLRLHFEVFSQDGAVSQQVDAARSLFEGSQVGAGPADVQVIEDFTVSLMVSERCMGWVRLSWNDGLLTEFPVLIEQPGYRPPFVELPPQSGFDPAHN